MQAPVSSWANNIMILKSMSSQVLNTPVEDGDARLGSGFKEEFSL